jgi:thermitase
VAVVDDGVDLDHPDLDPGDRSRVIQGYDFGDNDSNPGDDADHGTPVAGTIGARTDNNEGVAGLMWDLQIMPLKVVTSTGDIPYSVSAQAIDYARVNGADIINYSISGPSPSGVVSEAVYNAYASGMIFVGSSGNDYKGSVNYPAALHTAIGVGATDRGDQRYGYSNYGPSLDIAASSEFETTARYGSYIEFGGTS